MSKKNMILHIQAEWDAEAGVYVATSDDVPGLVTEAATIPELETKLKTMIPELMELNGLVLERGASLPLDILAHGQCAIQLDA
ncbi:MAG: DUF1902 domain-containing protein [Magnetococcus sp. WYHC-3]